MLPPEVPEHFVRQRQALDLLRDALRLALVRELRLHLADAFLIAQLGPRHRLLVALLARAQLLAQSVESRVMLQLSLARPLRAFARKLRLHVVRIAHVSADVFETIVVDLVYDMDQRR